MAVVVSKTYEFSGTDVFSETFSIAVSPMIPSLDGFSLNTLSKVSRFFHHLLNDPLIWRQRAQELGLVFSDARQEVRAFYEMREPKRRTYAFAAALLGTLSPTDFRKIPHIRILREKEIMTNWPRDATIITGSKWATYLHNYVPYIAFSLKNQSSHTEMTYISVIEETRKVSEALKNYLGRLFKGEPCGSWYCSQEQYNSVVSLCSPSSHGYFAHHTKIIMSFGLRELPKVGPWFKQKYCFG